MTIKFETNSGIHLPKLLTNYDTNITGIELGVWYGNNSGYLLQECDNIKLLYGIDPYLPYQDWNRYVTESNIKEIRNTAIANLKHFDDRFNLIEATAVDARKYFITESIDFIFIDGDHSFEMCYQDLNLYYDVVKRGGIFSGHDFSLPGVNLALAKFRKENNIEGNFKVIPNDVWYWIKD